jgi:hypothetical protein
LGPSLQDWTGEILATLEAHFRAAGADRPAVEAAVLFAAIDGISQHYALDPARHPLDAVADGLIDRYARTERGTQAKRGGAQAKPKAKGAASPPKSNVKSSGGTHGQNGTRNRERRDGRKS